MTNLLRFGVWLSLAFGQLVGSGNCAAGAHNRHGASVASNVRLPHIPDMVYPPTVTGIQQTSEDDDPEQRPGLFQGDIAIDPVSHGLWKVGLRYVRNVGE